MGVFPVLPSHGGNRGSNPLGDASKINDLRPPSGGRNRFVRKFYGKGVGKHPRTRAHFTLQSLVLLLGVSEPKAKVRIEPNSIAGF